MGQVLPTFKEVVALVLGIVALGLVLRYWKGANELLKTGLGGSNQILNTLEK